ncbi:MAG: DUF1330 domain-containing protein [Chloroflexi bacterium]|nr:DUF1330 domain-containing protein [Chloroflexota bacterium]
MVAWAIGAIESVNDEAGFAAYQELGGPTVAKYGGKRVASGTKIEVTDGTWSPVRMVVIEFENLEKAKTWYNSPEYQAAVEKRISSSDGGFIFVDGA